MARTLYSRKPKKTAMAASRFLHRAIVKFIRGCDLDCKNPVRVYFNQGRGLYPDRITILHLPADIGRGLVSMLAEWQIQKDELVWGCKVRKVIPSKSSEDAFLIFPDLLGRIQFCLNCSEETCMTVSRRGKNPSVKCTQCGEEFHFPPPTNTKEKRHYKASLR